MKLDLTKPCNACPFRRKSAPGWLGPWRPEEIIFALGREVFPCHKTIPHGEEIVLPEDDRLQGCAGAAIFLNNKCERSRHPQNAEHQAKVGMDKAKVFSNSSEFINHHISKKAAQS